MDTLAPLARNESRHFITDPDAPSGAARIVKKIISHFAQPFIVERREL